MLTEPSAPETKHAKAPSAAQEKPLHESLEDASLLLWFATREGKEVDDEVLRDIVRAQSALRGGAQDPEVEGTFWTAYRKLAKAVQPASIDSILSTYNYPFGYHHGRTGKRRLADARATKKVYTRFALGILFVLLFFQVYFVVGNTFRASLEKNRDDFDSITGALRSKTTAFASIRNRPIERNPAALDDVLQPADQEYLADDIALFSDAIESDTTLTKWLKSLTPEQQLRFLTLLDIDNKHYRICRLLDMIEVELGVLAFYSVRNEDGKRIDLDCKIYLEQRVEARRDLDQYSDKLHDAEVRINQLELGDLEQALTQPKVVLVIVGQFVLPLLYGLLGSQAYILRTLSSEIRNVTFTRGSEIRYSLRWPLGMLAGVTLGLVFVSEHFAGLSAITPLGLAFLAGYGVELLFTGLDRMVSAFTGEGAERPRPA
jgi:hypothetical protein